MTEPAVLCLGETMVLVTPTEPTPLESAELFRLAVGGAESTVAMYLAEFGFSVSWASILGQDPLGGRILRALRDNGVETSHVQSTPERPTGVYFKDPRGGATQVHYYRRGSAASSMDINFLDLLPLAGSRLVHTSGITPGLSDSCREMMEVLPGRLRSTGAAFSFDVNYRPGVWSRADAAPVLLSLARQADYVFVGLDEAAILWNTGSSREVYDLIKPVGKLIVKDGEVGATEWGNETEVFMPSPRVEVVEAVGAGDAFAAGYLAAALSGNNAREALDSGHKTAARALQSTADFVPLKKAWNP